MFRTSRSRSRRWCAPASRGPDCAGAKRPGARLRAARRSDSGGGARAAGVGRARRARGAARRSLSSSSSALPRQPTTVAERIAGHRPRLAAGRAAASAELEFFNGLGGFADGRPRIRHHPRPGPVDAGAVDQRDRQPQLRLPGVGRRRRLHLVGEQPREPADAVVQRSGHRSLRAKRSICATRTPAISGARRRCRSAMRRRPMSPAMVGATAGSSTPRTASRASCCSMCRSTIRSRSRA